MDCSPKLNENVIEGGMILSDKYLSLLQNGKTEVIIADDKLEGFSVGALAKFKSQNSEGFVLARIVSVSNPINGFVTIVLEKSEEDN